MIYSRYVKKGLFLVCNWYVLGMADITKMSFLNMW